MGNIVAIVGRPNVGKSTLFNRLLGEFKAIVDDFSGVTRDRHYGKAEWQNKEFTLIDTGGYVHNSTDIFESAIRDQVKIAMNEADVLLFMVDVQVGITDLDSAFASLLRRTKKPVLVVVNKCDTFEKNHDSYEFYSLGFDKLFCISSGSGAGTGELLDEIISLIPEEDLVITEEEEQIPKIAVVGRPNVGKSSLVNALLGEDRNIVTDVAGTTRDTINSHYQLFGKEFLLVDTAGIRRKKNVSEDIEFYSVMRSLRALENCDIVILVLDAQLGLDQQDLNLVSLAIKNGKGLVILVNKWDLMTKETNTARNFELEIKEKLKPFDDVPIIFTSAIEKQRIHKAVEVSMQVFENRTRRITTSKLNEFIERIIDAYPPPSIKGKFISIKYVTQLPGRSPKFVFFCNLPQYVTDSYKRYLENKMREEYDFSGVPITIYFRKK
ncbi:MAG: ribosome biogenesis GTPase Der [Bacteroidetes bacterium B1(2017)]|nr:MAG: ribosome biogenesis GTPase Der [Bacteroidetes bacterium B1(2017)]